MLSQFCTVCKDKNCEDSKVLTYCCLEPWAYFMQPECQDEAEVLKSLWREMMGLDLAIPCTLC